MPVLFDSLAAARDGALPGGVRRACRARRRAPLSRRPAPRQRSFTPGPSPGTARPTPRRRQSVRMLMIRRHSHGPTTPIPIVSVTSSQLPQTETESGDQMKCRRFRLENGDGGSDRDEVLRPSIITSSGHDSHPFESGVQLADGPGAREPRVPDPLVFQVLPRQT